LRSKKEHETQIEKLYDLIGNQYGKILGLEVAVMNKNLEIQKLKQERASVE